MEKIVFTTRKPNIVDRIRGYFQRKRYMRKFAKEQAKRYAVWLDLKAERRAAL